MTYSEDFLRKICDSEVIGGFKPFSDSDIDTVEKYIKKIISRLEVNKEIKIKVDFSYYGSGFASYINVRVSKANKSDTKVVKDRDETTERTNGLLLFISLI